MLRCGEMRYSPWIENAAPAGIAVHSAQNLTDGPSKLQRHTFMNYPGWHWAWPDCFNGAYLRLKRRNPAKPGFQHGTVYSRSVDFPVEYHPERCLVGARSATGDAARRCIPNASGARCTPRLLRASPQTSCGPCRGAPPHRKNKRDCGGNACVASPVPRTARSPVRAQRSSKLTEVRIASRRESALCQTIFHVAPMACRR